MPALHRHSLLAPLLFTLSLLTMTSPARALSPIPGYPELLCDSEYVFADSSGTVRIFVHPNGSDDTGNLQCALDEAVRLGVPTVQLISADYHLSSLSIEGFNGTLQGTSKNDTSLHVLDGSIDCFGMIDSFRVPAALKFIGGEPRIRYLGITANAACQDGSDLVTIVHFTGVPASATQCANAVTFAELDRVIIDGGNRLTGPRIAVSAQAEGYQLHPMFPGACNRSLLGTFRLNRSELYNTQFGVATTMRSNAQVDITFNTFGGQDASVWIENANQNTTVTKNTFLGHAADALFYAGVVQTVYLEDGDVPPKTSRLVIHENRFDMAPFSDESILGVLLIGRQATEISTIITGNAFQLSPTVAGGIVTSEVSNGHIASNRFSGPEEAAFTLDALLLNNEDEDDAVATGWTVSGNAFGQFNVIFSTPTRGNYFGPGQAAGILDQGTDNIVVAEGNYPWIIDQKMESAGIARPDNRAVAAWQRLSSTGSGAR